MKWMKVNYIQMGLMPMLILKDLIMTGKSMYHKRKRLKKPLSLLNQYLVLFFNTFLKYNHNQHQ